MTYNVSIDVTMCKMIRVDASSATEARALVEAMFDKNPYDVACGFSHYVGHDVTDIYRDDEV